MEDIRGLSILVAILFVAGFSGEASGFMGRGFWSRQTTKIGLSMINYSGEETESLTGEKGFGGEIVTERGDNLFSLFGKVRGESSSASAKFIDGGAESSLSYQLLMGEAVIGFKIGLVPSDVFTPYVSGAGVLGLANLTFSPSNLSTLDKSQTSTVFGYEIGAGADLRFNDFLVWGEVQSRVCGGDMAGKGSFGLDGLRLVIGVGW